MSEERTERRLVERFRANYLGFVEAFNRHDFEAAFAGMPPDFVFDISGVGLYERATGMIRGSSGVVMHSREELIAFFRDWLEEFPDWQVDVEDFAEPTPGVVLVTHMVGGSGRVSGVPTARRITEVWDMRSRQIRISQHQDENDALEAAGLSE